MKKLTFAVTAAVIAFCSLAQAQDKLARIDVTQPQTPGVAVLVPGTAEGGKIGNCTWFPSEAERNSVITSTFPAGQEWKKGSLSFTPSQDAKALTIVLLSQGSGNPTVLFADLKITGAELKNGDFEAGLADWWLNTAQDGSQAEIIANAYNGANAANVSEPHRIAQSFKAKGGIPITITFYYKLAK